MADTQYVRNAVVNMDWEVERFFEHKADGCFVAATQDYVTAGGDVITVIFMVGRAFLLFNSDTEKPMTHEEFVPFLKNLTDSYGSEFDPEELEETAEIYIDLSTGGEVDPNLAEAYGLDDEVCNDILERLADLSNYTETTYTDMA